MQRKHLKVIIRVVGEHGKARFDVFIDCRIKVRNSARVIVAEGEPFMRA